MPAPSWHNASQRNGSSSERKCACRDPASNGDPRYERDEEKRVRISGRTCHWYQKAQPCDFVHHRSQSRDPSDQHGELCFPLREGKGGRFRRSFLNAAFRPMSCERPGQASDEDIDNSCTVDGDPQANSGNHEEPTQHRADNGAKAIEEGTTLRHSCPIPRRWWRSFSRAPEAYRPSRLSERGESER